MPIKNKGQVEVHSEKNEGKIIETTNFDYNYSVSMNISVASRKQLITDRLDKTIEPNHQTIDLLNETIRNHSKNNEDLSRH